MLRTLEGRRSAEDRGCNRAAGKKREEIPLRLILGIDAEKRVQQAEAARASEAEKWRPLTVSTVFEDGRFDSRLYLSLIHI